MKIVDANLLLYAVNRSAPQHRAVRAWWETALPVGLAWVVVLGFLRLSTNPHVFANPLTVAKAVERVEAWLAQPNVEWIVETDEHWRLFRELILECGTGGNLTTDAHLAALAISNGATLYSCDTDFVRFQHQMDQSLGDRQVSFGLGKWSMVSRLLALALRSSVGKNCIEGTRERQGRWSNCFLGQDEVAGRSLERQLSASREAVER